MKRPTFTNSRLQEDSVDSFSALAPNGGNIYLDKGVSPYLLGNDNNLSDSDSLSDSSRKIRKKRNTYQKISDEIRMQLLEAVQNGETLKSAAKFHKINYSSAKSILHTYRKEGRILKKSAQERTTKKRSLANQEYEPSKPAKHCKKENIHVSENDYPLTQSFGNQKVKCETINHSEEPSFKNPKKVLTENSSNTKYSTHYESHTDNQPLTLPDSFHSAHKEDESTLRVLSIIENENPTEANHHHHNTYKDDNSVHKPKFFDNFYLNHHYEAPNEHVFGDNAEFMNHMNFARDFDPYNEMVSNLHMKPLHEDQGHHANGAHVLDDKTGYNAHGVDFDMFNSENTNGCPLKSFMDTQRLLRDALRKASFSSIGGKYSGCRKSSVDFL